jgi:hypothetical protein
MGRNRLDEYLLLKEASCDFVDKSGFSGGRFGALRTRVAEMLCLDETEAGLSELFQLPPRQLVNPLLSFLYSPDETTKYRAVSAVGKVVAQMAVQDMEGARTIMRRLMWSLNDESGAIGWGSAEAMGEIMARHEQLAEEYFRILVSYIRDDGCRLEHDLLECGVLWGLGRLAQAKPHLLKDSFGYIASYLTSTHPTQRGLAVWALGFLEEALPRAVLDLLLSDQTEITVYEQGSLHRRRISELAARLPEASG